MVFHDKPL
jgi:hypothetical protein